MDPIRIGVIGGSGLYNMAELTDREEIEIETPFGSPSAPVIIGKLRGQRVAFIPRHGIGHRLNPSEVPYRANIYAMKTLGVTHLIGVSACGSLQEQYAPGHILIPDQVLDFTRGRKSSFFEDGLVVHVSVPEPFSAKLSGLLYESVQAVGGTVHQGGRFITVEGPRFSTKGESHVFRQWGMDIIGMTTSPEAYLAREAEMHFAIMAHVTDYDSWHEEEEPVTVEMVIAIMNRNLETAQQALAVAVERLAADFDAYTEPEIESALAAAMITNKAAIPSGAIERLKPLVNKYFDQD